MWLGKRFRGLEKEKPQKKTAIFLSQHLYARFEQSRSEIEKNVESDLSDATNFLVRSCDLSIL